MEISTTLSTSRPAPSNWVDSLFSRMESMYGNKFLDMWREADIDAVKAIWGEAMGKLAGKELKRGVSAMMFRDWPPTLPEFVKLCKTDIGPDRTPDLPRLAEPRSPNAAAYAGKMLNDLGAAGILEPKEDHTRWYKKILERHAAADRTIPSISLKFAQDAAETHGYQPQMPKFRTE